MPAGSSAMMGIAVSQAAIAQQAAHEAEVSRCKGIISQFDSHGAAVSAMQDYAGCVQTVYPQPTDGSTIIMFKVLFAMALAGGLVGAGIGWKDREYSSWGEILFMSLCGFIGTPIVAASISGLFYGIYWLFT